MDVGVGADVEVGPRRIGVRVATGVVAPFAVVPGVQPAAISVTTAAERKIVHRVVFGWREFPSRSGIFGRLAGIEPVDLDYLAGHETRDVGSPG